MEKLLGKNRKSNEFYHTGSAQGPAKAGPAHKLVDWQLGEFVNRNHQPTKSPTHQFQVLLAMMIHTS